MSTVLQVLTLATSLIGAVAVLAINSKLDRLTATVDELLVDLQPPRPGVR